MCVTSHADILTFLLDQNLSTWLAALLVGAGHDVVQTSQLGLSRAADFVRPEPGRSRQGDPRFRHTTSGR
jgi:hypothetical protein